MIDRLEAKYKGVEDSSHGSTLERQSVGGGYVEPPPSTPSKGRSRASSVPPVMPTPTRKTTYGEPSSKGKDPPRYYKKKGPGIPDPNKYQRTLDNPIDNPVPYSASSLPVSRQTSDRTRSTTNVPSDVSGFGGGPSGREFPSVGT